MAGGGAAAARRLGGYERTLAMETFRVETVSGEGGIPFWAVESQVGSGKSEGIGVCSVDASGFGISFTKNIASLERSENDTSDSQWNERCLRAGSISFSI